MQFATVKVKRGRVLRLLGILVETIELTSRTDRPAEMTTPALSNVKNGIRRNLAKMILEVHWALWWVKKEQASHGWHLTEYLVNDPVTFLRHAPYTSWHVPLYIAILYLVVRLGVWIL